MRLIKRITDRDIFGGTAELIDKVSRYAARGVLIDDQLNTAMMYMSKRDLYKLPGGGIEAGETIEEALLREIKEETGYEAEIVCELGYIEEHKNRNNFLQISYCFAAKAKRKIGAANLTDSERKLGMAVNWMPFDAALEVMNKSLTKCNHDSSKFMVFRDKFILEIAASIKNQFIT